MFLSTKENLNLGSIPTIDIFNSTTEIALRILLILRTVAPTKISLDRMVAYDFMTIYGAHFGVSPKNLHGYNRLCFLEYTARREIAKSAIRYLVRNDLIKASVSSKGFLYSINGKGMNVLGNIKVRYSELYEEILRTVINRYGRRHDKTLVMHINKVALVEGGN